MNYRLPIMLVCAFTLLLGASPAHAADEIKYGHILDRKGNTLSLEYKGPGGASYYTCTTEGKCKSEGKSAKMLYPSLLGSTEYPHNNQGTYAIKQFTIGTYAYYFVYDISSEKPKRVGYLPIFEIVSQIKFTPSGDSLILTKGNQVARYDITGKTMSGWTTLPGDRPFFSISNDGRYVAFYSYSEGHKIYDLIAGTMIAIASDAPSYVEFSEDEKTVAYSKLSDDYKTLYVASVNGSDTKKLTNKAVAEDYLFVGNTLFFMANESDPLQFDLYKYEEGKTTKIDTDVSYGDYLSRVNGQLAYLKVTGTRANVVVYNPEKSTSTTLAAAGEGAAADDIVRKSVYIAGRYGAHLAPKDSKKTDTLYVWLHGGPQRQTSVGYHSYLSYAVYDELLEKLVQSDSHVLKLDYTGSTGYGNSFIKALHLNIGKSDVADVRNAVKEFLKDHKSVKQVYLIGNSYGGYLSLKAIADNPELYDGAISINGVTDWYSLINRIPSSPFITLFEGVPGNNNLQAYLTASAYTGLVQKVKDEKILVVYGENDGTVPTWQSTQYVEFAKANNKDVTLLALPGEEHIIREKKSLEKLCTTIEDTFAIDDLTCKTTSKSKSDRKDKDEEDEDEDE